MNSTGKGGTDSVDQIYATNNPFDVPMLDPRWQATALDPPLTPWGTRRRGKRMPGTWHFYVDDYRFERLWDRPDLLLETGALAAIEPNFSVFDQTPVAVAISQTYRKRWLARYWQDHGIKVWVDLNVAAEYRELNLLGVPPSWRAFATRGYEDRPEAALEECRFASARFHSPIFLIYGGGPKVRAISDEVGAIHVPDQQSAVRDRVRHLLAGHP